MSPGIRRLLGWVPTVVVGVACAVAAEVAIALLLYSGPGFTRSLTTLLTLEALALAIGLRFPVPAPEVVDGLRRRWLLALMAFLAATVFGTLWTILPDVGSGRFGQGVGLAVLAGLPLYACGALLSGLAREADRMEGAATRADMAPTAALGAAAGFALTGVLLPRAPTPSSLLVGCLVLLSLGGMAYGAVRAGRARRRVIAEGCVGPPPVRIEERVPAGASWTQWVLLEGEVVRAVRRFLPEREEPAEGRDVRAHDDAWDLRAIRELAPAGRPWRGLFVGGGASLAPGEAIRAHGAVAVTVLERAHCIVDLGRSHFDTGLGGESEEPDSADAPRPDVRVGNLADALRSLDGVYDLVVFDGRVLDAVGGDVALSRAARDDLIRLLAPAGVIVWGPKAAHHPRGLSASEWITDRRDRREPLEEVLVVRRAGAAEAATTAAEGGPATS